MLPESPEHENVALAPREGMRLWMQIVLMILLAALAQGIGLGFAYASRCKPGQGNEWCGLGSLAGVFLGFGAAACILLAGTIMIVLKRKRRGEGGGAGGGANGTHLGALRVLAVVFGVVLLLPCSWMLGFGWIRNHGDGGLWLGVALGLALIAGAFVRRRQA